MIKSKKIFLTFSLLSILNGCASSSPSTSAKTIKDKSAHTSLVTEIRQITFSGKRAGESYFSNDGKQMVFQSEREAQNPFYQIYLKNFETGLTKRLSPGYGKTTCAWIHPDKKKVLFSSTHHDPQARQKMAEELDIRKKGKARPYSWDFDENYDIFEANTNGGGIKNLTKIKGYDAEASWSPDGKIIIFASDRHIYTDALSSEEKEALKSNPSALVELYMMNADGSDVRRLTKDIGYDGGPFFSFDGKKIVWRKFSKDGRRAEIYTMNSDGSDVKKITALETLSWAPFFHPSGDYIIFGSALFGHSNFELFIVRADGSGDPIRVTDYEKFDSLPVFLPSGAELAWTSQRSWDGSSQIFIGKWDDEKARALLGLKANEKSEPKPTAEKPASLAQIQKNVEYLASAELAGRLTGSPGEELATKFVAAQFKALGLVPAGDKANFLQAFDFPSGVEIGPSTQLKGDKEMELDKAWRPLAMSASGKMTIQDVVFVGYGIVAPATENFKAYDSYNQKDVKDKWVLALRYMPEKLSEKEKIHLTAYSDLPTKVIKAKENGARGIIFINGPNSKNAELVPFGKMAADSGIFALTVNDDLMKSALTGISLQELQNQLDSGKEIAAAKINFKAEGQVELVRKKAKGHNVIGRLVVGAAPSATAILVGAHADHLGVGETTTSRADKSQLGMPHLGADDNASGVAGMLEIARLLVANKRNLKKDIIFAAWSGEELGLLGSSHYADAFKKSNLQEVIEAYVNLDMVGRLNEKIYLQGIASSKTWPAIIESAAAKSPLSIFLQEDPYLPTDVLKFYMLNVPVLSAFTGSHQDYHTPADTPDKINYSGIQQVASLLSDIVTELTNSKKLIYEKSSGPANVMKRAEFRVSLGTIPDYTQSPDLKGVKLMGVKPNSPAEKTGIKANDVVVELAGKKIININEYSDLLRILKPSEAVEIKVQREKEVLTLRITPEAR